MFYSAPQPHWQQLTPSGRIPAIALFIPAAQRLFFPSNRMSNEGRERRGARLSIANSSLRHVDLNVKPTYPCELKRSFNPSCGRGIASALGGAEVGAAMRTALSNATGVPPPVRCSPSERSFLVCVSGCFFLLGNRPEGLPDTRLFLGRICPFLRSPANRQRVENS